MLFESLPHLHAQLHNLQLVIQRPGMYLHEIQRELEHYYIALVSLLYTDFSMSLDLLVKSYSM